MTKLILILSLLFAGTLCATELKQSTAYHRMVFMVDSTDHVTGKASLTLTITSSQGGAAFGSISPTVTDRGSGWYDIALTTTHTNTLGDLCLHITGTGADPSDTRDVIIAWDKATALSSTTVGTVTTVTNAVTAGTVSDKTGYALTSAYDPAKTASQAGDVMKISAGTGANQISLSSGTVTVGTNNDKTGYSLSVTPPTSATIASAVWQDTTAGDFTTALSIGKSVLNGVTLGTGLTINGYTGNTPQTGDAYARIGAAGAGLTALGDAHIAHLDADVSSRMASYTQPTGFLGATFPSGTIANTTNITAGTITTATNLTNLPAITANWLTATGIAAGALNGKGDWNTTTPPTAAAIATATWQDLTSGSDFGTSASIGKLLKDDVDAAISSRSTYGGGDTSGTTTLLSRLTSTRAGLLDNLDATVSSRGTSTLTAANVWDLSLTGHTTSGTAGAALNAAGSAGDPWATALPGSYGAGTAGNIVGNNLNATVSSRSTYAGADTSGTTTLLSRITSGRATLLDNLDAAVSSRSTYSGADTSGTTTLLSRLTSGRASGLDNLDAAISSRMATFTLPTNFSSMAITAGGLVDINGKTGFSLISAYDPAKVDPWGVTLPSSYTGQKAGALLWKIGNKP